MVVVVVVIVVVIDFRKAADFRANRFFCLCPRKWFPPLRHLVLALDRDLRIFDRNFRSRVKQMDFEPYLWR